MKKYHDLFMKELWIKIKEKSLNKTRKITVLSSFLVFLTFVLLLRCNPVVKTLGPFTSPNAEESKKRGVFLWEYYPTTTKVYDTINFEIKEVFAEKQYQYYSYKDLRYKISEDKFQVIVVSKINLYDFKYSETWTPVSWALEGFYLRSAQSLVSKYNSSPPDSINIKVLRLETDKNGSPGKNDKKIIGFLTLHRK